MIRPNMAAIENLITDFAAPYEILSLPLLTATPSENFQFENFSFSSTGSAEMMHLVFNPSLSRQDLRN